MSELKLKRGNLVTPEKVVTRDIILRNGRIDLSGDENICENTVDLSGKFIVPGFIDIHFHGFNLFEFTAGLYEPQNNSFDDSDSAYEYGFDMLVKTLPRFGVTGVYIGSWAAQLEVLKNCYGKLKMFLDRSKKTVDTTRIFGGFLEGSFINPKMAGAQNPRCVFDHTPEAFDSIEDGGVIKLANVVPDLGERSVKLTEYLTSKGIVVGAGHTNATCEQFAMAMKAGLKYCIHFTNGPTGGSYKPFDDGGAIEAVLKFDNLYAELIADGYHVNPAYIRDIIKRKGIDNIVGISDAIFTAGSDLKEFKIADTKGQVSDDGNYICVVGKPNTLYSSNLTINRGFENMLNWMTSEMEGIWNRRHEACNFEDTLVAVAKFYSTNPCMLTGLVNEGYGMIEDGAKADVCVLDITGSPGNYKVDVELTIVGGNVVYSKY